MQNIRKYGSVPYSIAVIHGGPGASGGMAPVATEISSSCGILEPLQTALSVDGQVEELKKQLEQNGTAPFILIGYSWGAMLSLIMASRYPSLVKQLILIGCGPLEPEYANKIMQTRLNRLPNTSKNEVSQLFQILNNPLTTEIIRNETLKRIGRLFHKTDSYSPIDYGGKEELEVDHNIYDSVWKEVVQMRQSREFVNLIKNIRCPIMLIHGDYDPHPFEGVKLPLEKILGKRVTSVLLQKCGHTPWNEKFSRNTFYRVLLEALNLDGKAMTAYMSQNR